MNAYFIETQLKFETYHILGNGTFNDYGHILGHLLLTLFTWFLLILGL